MASNLALRVQAVSGLLFATFVFVHLGNLLLAPLGATLFDQAQSLTRSVYQFAPIEVALLTAGLLHGGIGVWRLLRERRALGGARARWHRYSGVFLVVVIIGHVLAVRGSSFWFDVYPAFDGIAASVAYAPYYFYPYYFLLGVAGAYHGLNGTGIALARFTSLRLALSRRTLSAVTAGIAILLLAALTAFGGVWFDVGNVLAGEFAQLYVALGLADIPVDP